MIKTKERSNPFPVMGYHGAEYFCDRETETSQLIENIKNGSSTTLLSLRRIGKTGLIHHVFDNLSSRYKCVYLDILSTENISQFLNQLASAIIQAIPQKTSFGEKIWLFIKSLRPVISFDPLTGDPNASFEVKPAEAETNIAVIFKFLEEQDFKTVIAIDEFQQILFYPEKNVDAWLRSIIQQLQRVLFIFSGSQQQLITDLFSSPKRPFFRSTQIIKLDIIDKNTYADFIVKSFENYNKTIDQRVAEEMIEWANGYTYYVQLICNRTFSATEKRATSEVWKHQANQILKEQEVIFFAYRNMLTIPQWQLLKAIANEIIVYQPTSKSFISKYALGGSATVLRSMKSLLKYELIYQEFDKEGKSYLGIYDILFAQWVKQNNI